MKNTLLFVILLAFILIFGIWFLFLRGDEAVVIISPPLATSTAPAIPLATNNYTDSTLGFSITLPTVLASTSNDSQYSVDKNYRYEAIGPRTTISGVKFSIPKATASGTNLSVDTYISVEHLAVNMPCTAELFLENPKISSSTIIEGTRTYSFASTSGAAAGNRYEESVYAIASSSPCLAVRYFIHSGAYENYPEGSITQFDKAALLAQFDQVRRTLTIRK